MEEMRKLIDNLNHYRDMYYNKNISEISDQEYDALFDALKLMEYNYNITYPDSPTQSVGYIVQSNLEKVKHNHAMMSLDKTKDTADIESFAGSNKIIAMLEMDGLTCSIHYDETGNLISAETRGDGIIGENITENIKQVKNVPLKINNNGIPFTIDGEIIVTKDVFDLINRRLDKKFTHPRNYASGSIRQLDTKVTAGRKLSFIAWKVVEGCSSNSMDESLQFAKKLGFTIVPKTLCFNVNDYKHIISILEDIANIEFYPIDGIVFSYDDIDYGNSFGNTTHHPRHSLAYKFYNEEYETTLRDIEWNTTRTGIVSPVAVFDPIDLDGALTSRATLHNVSYMKQLKLGLGDTITVFRANEVIPKIAKNLTQSNTYEYPTVCPCCKSNLNLRKDGVAENLYCNNPQCSAKLVDLFTHFVSKNCMNIDGMSEATISTLLSLGYITNYSSIYHLEDYKEELIRLPGYGEKSINKLLSSIEASRNVKLENFINSLSIPGIGVTGSKIISRAFKGSHFDFVWALDNNFDFSTLPDFGYLTNEAIHKWWDSKDPMIELLPLELNFIKETQHVSSNSFMSGKLFVVTGKFETLSRIEIEEIITKNGGKVASSVSKNTDYLLTNDANSGSSKAKKAMELNVPIMGEKQFLSYLEM